MNDHILIVDDEEDILKLITNQLTKNGYVCKTAATGEEALASVEAQRPRLVLLDLVLPDLSGFEVCRTMKEKYPDMKVIICTAKIDAADARKAIEVRADDLTLKSENLSGILSTLEDSEKK